jgi:hypothetical protein
VLSSGDGLKQQINGAAQGTILFIHTTNAPELSRAKDTCHCTIPLQWAHLATLGDLRVKNTNFWIGNGLLAAALLILLFMGTLSEMLGIGAVILWMCLAAAGTYFIMKS